MGQGMSQVEYKQGMQMTAEQLREADPLIRYIDSLSASNKPISFDWLRDIVGRDRDLWSQLGRGRAVLSSCEELDQYLHSYGPMVACQWRFICEGLDFTPEPVRFVDYGCGQGLAGLLLFDSLGDQFSRILERVVLVEPSPFALVRAEAVYKAIAPDAEVVCVNKAFDELTVDDLLPCPKLDAIHVFSNVLDMPGFNHGHVFDVMLQPGRHDILVVSNDRNVAGGSQRITSLKKALEDPLHAEFLNVRASNMADFRCGPADNTEKYSAIGWLASVEVLNG